MKPKAAAPVEPHDESPRNDGDDFRKILDTFMDKQTSDLHSRQAALLGVLVTQTHTGGFRLADLPAVHEILVVAYEKIASGVEALVEPVCDVIAHCSKPYLRVKSNEEFTHPHLLQGIVRLFGQFLTSFEPQVQVAAAETLRHVATGACLTSALVRHHSNVDEKTDDQRPLRRDFSQQLIEQCGIVEAAAAALRTLLEDQADKHATTTRMDLLLFPIVDLIQEISNWGPNARILTREGCPDHMLEILDNIEDLRDEFLPLCLEIVWNILETCEQTTLGIQTCTSRARLLDSFRTTNAIYAMGSLESFQILHKLLTRLLVHGYRKQDKELRNTTLMIADILASKPRNLAFFRDAGFLHTLVKYATAVELPAGVVGSVAKESHFASSCDEDFEFKHMLWVLLSDVTRGNTENTRIVADSPFLQVLLMYVAPDDHPGAALWSPSQRHVLQTLALNVLSNLTPAMPSLFLANQGHAILLDFVQKSNDQEACAIALLLFLQLVPEMQTDLGDIGGVDVMLELFTSLDRACAVRRTAISVCGALCRQHPANQVRFRRAHGVSILGKHLHFEPAHAVSQDNLIIAVVGCVWASVIGNPESEIALIQTEGVDNLLDLLEICPVVMRGQVLGVLAELCENPKAVAYFQAWKSKKQFGATQMLLRMYADEEKRLGVQRPPNGIIQNISRPLDVHATTVFGTYRFVTRTNNSLADDKTTLPPPPSPPSSAVAFVRLKQALVHSKGTRHTDPNRRLVMATEKVDLRSKIFAVLASVGFSCITDDLSFEEQITMAVAKEFPVFHIGDAWLDVKTALYAQGIRPIYADALLIEMELEHVYSIVTHVRVSQQAIATRQANARAEDEALFFAGVRHQKEQERQALSKKNVTMSSMKSHLEAKKRKAEMMRKSSTQTAGDEYSDGGGGGFVFTDPPPIFHDL
ncbi:Aste57867_16291 [Aphanomyces stellatus]|uniref:Aste57867_16291 protein n=1 Tax=Aphanomyces stellatus TaxID=120398 RepID=A0A485L6G3_9STRA|nr:hypothetical protein As57867_016234 [Aphanomyces stellatus]VFT93067.1 Aste57867_16291 [Aphanomyces stellatus]